MEYKDTKLYGSVYQRQTAVLLSKKYTKIREKWRRKFAKLGYPIPKKGFSSAAIYDEWRDRFHKKIRDNIDAFTEQSPIKDIATSFGMNLKEDGNQERLFIAFYHGRVFRPVNKGHIKAVPNAIQITIPAWTTQDEWIHLWDSVKIFKEQLHDGKSFTRKFPQFEKEFRFYEMYYKAKSLKTSHNNKVMEILKRQPEFQKFTKDFNILDSELDALYRNVPTKFNKLLKNLDFSTSTA